ncbi:MAG: PIN domain-containing protein [Candidatus Bathyarchaeia archaeon]|jgi:predicted nucleic acid-binding protein
MTKRFVVDAYAWVEYLIGSKCGSKVATVFGEENNEAYTCAVTVAEVISKAARDGQDVEAAYDILLSDSQVVSVNEEISKEAGVLHAEMRKTEKDFGLADAYVLATARRLKAKVLTGDMHFKSVREAVLIT